MAARPKALYRATHAAIAAVNTVVPAGKQWAITNVILANNHATVTTRVYVSLDGVVLVPGVSLLPGALFTLDCAQVLEAGKTLSVSIATASTVTVHISGVETDVV